MYRKSAAGEPAVFCWKAVAPRTVLAGLLSLALLSFGILILVHAGSDFHRGHLIGSAAVGIFINMGILLALSLRNRPSPALPESAVAEDAAIVRGLAEDVPADEDREQSGVTAIEWNRISASVKDMLATLQSSACSELKTVDDIAASLTALGQSTIDIATDAEELLSASASASSATQEISATIKEVSLTTVSLDTAADTIHKATNQIASSLKQVSANLVLLSELTASAGTSAGNISSAIKDISDHAQDQAAIARDVKDTAASTGLEAVDGTRQGMERIRQEVFTTSASIESLTSRSKQIDQIVGVIKDVADETNLLALNAAILAAQAGEEGKAFAIIADKIRALAQRSTESTKAIGAIIHHVQRDITDAGKAVKKSIVEVDNGVSVSRAAETALTEIVAKAETSLGMALKVESSIMLQSKNVELNASAIQNFKKMSGDIQKSVVKQSQSADEIVRGIRELRAGTGFVKQTMAEQAITSESIAEVVNSVFTRAQVIAKGSAEQAQHLENMVESLEEMRDRSESGILLCHDLESAVAVFEGHSVPSLEDDAVSDAPDSEPLSDPAVPGSGAGPDPDEK